MTTLEEANQQAAIEDALIYERARRIARRTVDAEERPPVELPPTLTLAELLARAEDPVQWRAEGWLPAGGRALLAAPAKAGKTHLVLNLVRSLVDGVPFLDRDLVTPVVGKVAVLDFEMSEHQLRRWYARIGITATERVLLYSLRGRAAAFDPRDDKLRAAWAALLREHRVEFLVWDCLSPVVKALGLDENHDLGLLLTPFDALLREAGGLEALVVHHTGHAGERARGDSSALGWSDANWTMVRDGEQRYIKADGRDVSQTEALLSLDEETERLSLVGGDRKTARHAAAMEAVLRWLTAAEAPLNKRQIEATADESGVPRAAAREALASLVAIGQVTVEHGANRAILHRLNPQFAGVPDCAAGSPARPAAGVPPPYKAAPGEHTTEERIKDGGLSDEQRAILERIETAT